MKKNIIFIILILVSFIANAQSDKEPDINDTIAVQKEPETLNMNEVRMGIGYPQIAVDAYIEGLVVARVLVNSKGAYVKHKIIRQGHPLLAKQIEKHIHKLKFSPAIQKDQPIQFWVNVPFRFKLEKDYQEQAIKKQATYLSGQIKKDKKNASLLLSRGIAYIQLGKYKAAEADFEKSIEINLAKEEQNNEINALMLFSAQTGRAEANLGLEEWATAKQYFDEALETNQKHKLDNVTKEVLPILFNERAIAQFKLHNYEEAIQDAEKAARLKPESEYKLISAIKEKNASRIAYYLRRLLKSSSTKNSLYKIGYHQMEAKEYSEAIQTLTTLIEQAPGFSHNLYKYRGYSYLKTEQVQLALKDLLKAQEFESEDGQTLYYLGLTYLKKGDKQKACQSINKAIKLKWENEKEVQEALKQNCN